LAQRYEKDLKLQRKKDTKSLVFISKRCIFAVYELIINNGA
jgi:hypothetical protein